jgi:uncharacterized protein (DUF1800 family)
MMSSTLIARRPHRRIRCLALPLVVALAGSNGLAQQTSTHHGHSALARAVAETAAESVASVDRDQRRTVPRGEETLFLATLTPQAGAVSSGSGSATLTLLGDEATALLRHSYQGLTGPLNAAHIHAADGSILFDLDTAEPQEDGSLVWSIVPVGTFDSAEILSALRAGECNLNLHTAAYPNGEVTGFLRRASGSQSFVAPPAPPALPPGPPTAEEAARFLFQATFGPRPEEIAEVQDLGFSGWLEHQFSLPRASHLAYYDSLTPPGTDPVPGVVPESVFAQAIEGDDQLRQRVALALSELFVVSLVDADVRNFPDGLADYADLLAEHSFGNFRELLEAVTLHPTMGVFLDMLGSTRELPDLGRLPNENFAREILQLFSIGLYQLHPDGTLRLDSGNQPIPTYDQDVVLGFSRALTGWSFGGLAQNVPALFFRTPRAARDFRRPMEPWALFHDDGEKLLLNGEVLLPGLGAQADLEAALDNVFLHPNVGPFVCRQLIQRLTTSNPSPGYVYRCALAFAGEGGGTRGDLRAVLRAILLDYEARSAEIAVRQDFGHLREPIVRFLGLLRTLDAEPAGGRWRFVGIDRPGLGLGQVPFRAPTVFNFFEPTFALPGEIAQAGLVSPEFQITTETTAIGAANLHYAVLAAASANGPQIRVDLSPFVAPQAPDDATLLDRVDLLLYAGTMSAETRGILAEALADPAFPLAPQIRALQLLWLVSVSPEFAVQK